MPGLSLETLPLLLALIVPGFVWSQVHRYLQVAPRTQDESWLGVFTLSAINFAVWSWWIPSILVNTIQAIAGRTALSRSSVLGWLVVTLLGPTLLGTATGLANRTNRFRQFLVQRLKINIPSPIGTAWDYVFSECGREGALWASVTMKDGSVVEGYFSGRSLASSTPAERDLYLEHYFKTTDSGHLVPVEHGAGIWLAADQLKAIEFKWVQIKESKDGQ